MSSLNYKKQYRSVSFLSAPDLVALVATEIFGDAWVQNPARALFPFFRKVDAKTGVTAICRWKIFKSGRAIRKAVEPSGISFEEIGGLDDQQKQVQRRIIDAIGSGKLEVYVAPRGKSATIQNREVVPIFHEFPNMIFTSSYYVESQGKLKVPVLIMFEEKEAKKLATTVSVVAHKSLGEEEIETLSDSLCLRLQPLIASAAGNEESMPQFTREEALEILRVVMKEAGLTATRAVSERQLKAAAFGSEGEVFPAELLVPKSRPTKARRVIAKKFVEEEIRPKLF